MKNVDMFLHKIKISINSQNIFLIARRPEGVNPQELLRFLMTLA